MFLSEWREFPSAHGLAGGKNLMTARVSILYNNIIYLLTVIGLSPGSSGYFTCKQNMKLVTTKFKSGGLNEKHVVATWNVENHLSFCL